MNYTSETIKSILNGGNGRDGSNSLTEMLSLITPKYQDAYVFLSILNAIGLSIDVTQEYTDELFLQVVPQTATWGLPYWEQSVGISPGDVPITEEEREARANAVIAKKWQRRAMPPARLSSIAAATIGYDVSITDPAENGKFSVKVSALPYASLLTALCKILDKLKPAHLIYEIEYEAPTSTDIYVGLSVSTHKKVILTQNLI